MLAPFALAAVTSLRAAGPLSPRIANCRIEARLDAAAKTVAGRERLTWRNEGGAPAKDLRFHLYLNAFAHSETIFMRESKGEHRGFEWPDEAPSKWGMTDVRSVKLGGRALATRLVEDGTVMAVDLPRAVDPGETIELDIDFVSKLPRVVARTGFHGDFFLVAQWFPKIGVFERDRQGVPAWNCHPFHANSEFYADYGVYSVRLDVPAGWIVGASGVEVRRERRGDRDLHEFLAEDVHDFAWTAAPWLREARGRWEDVDVRVLHGPGNARMARRHLAAAIRSLGEFSRRFFPYPYRTLTVVSPPPGAEGAGGMEYPTFITTFDRWWLPRGVRLPEVVTEHEFGHQYFYGLLASNEFEEAWLDEGINSYVEIALLDSWYGRTRSLLSLPFARAGGAEMDRTSLARRADWDPVVQPAWRYVDAPSYGANTYPRTAMTMRALEGLIGGDRMAEVMRRYTRRWRFKHPTTEDFVAVVEEVAGRDLGWFLGPSLRGAQLCDYEVATVESRAVVPRFGYVEKDGKRVVVNEEDVEEDEPSRWESEIVVHRKGEQIHPVEIEIAFEKGERVREKWDGRDRWKRLTYARKEKVERAEIGWIWLDSDALNDGRYREPRRGPARRLAMVWQTILQALMETVGW